MRLTNRISNWSRRSGVGVVVLLAISSFFECPAADARFPVLRAAGVSYSNVIVTGTSTKDVFIRHAGGLATLRVTDLDAATRTALGYRASTSASAAEPSSATTSTTTTTNRLGKVLGAVSELGRQTLQPKKTIADAVDAEDNEEAEEEDTPQLARDRLIGRWIATGLCVAVVILYFPFCRSCQHLCRRSGSPSSFLVWLPGWKRLALFKATNLSWFWFFFGLVIPIIGAGAWIVCCVRLCDIFHRSRWLTLPMLIPFFGWLAFIYMDRLSREEDNDPAVRSLDMRMAA